MPRMITRLVLESDVSQVQKIGGYAIGSGINRIQKFHVHLGTDHGGG